MSKIIIKKAVATQRSVKGKDGATYLFNEQQCAIEKDGADFPEPFRIRLAEGQAPYPAGDYTVDISSFFVGQYGDLQLGRRVALIPVPAGK